jgi:hypothetical protein
VAATCDGLLGVWSTAIAGGGGGPGGGGGRGLLLAGVLAGYSRERGWLAFWALTWPWERVWVVGVSTPADELLALGLPSLSVLVLS